MGVIAGMGFISTELERLLASALEAGADPIRWVMNGESAYRLLRESGAATAIAAGNAYFRGIAIHIVDVAQPWLDISPC